MQGSAYFIMASTTNDPFKLARMASFVSNQCGFKGVALAEAPTIVQVHQRPRRSRLVWFGRRQGWSTTIDNGFG
jgi:hypothetical protein